MARLPVYNCFHPIMKKETELVEDTSDELKKLIKDMFETMYLDDGIGLAANQVGVGKSILVIDISASKEAKIKEPPLVMINPKITAFSEEENEFLEGCLSVPTIFENVTRPKEIEVVYYDADMKEIKRELGDVLARVAQHEIDHLNGKLFFELLSPLRRSLISNKLKKLKKGKIKPDYPMVLPNGELME